MNLCIYVITRQTIKLAQSWHYCTIACQSTQYCVIYGNALDRSLLFIEYFHRILLMAMLLAYNMNQWYIRNNISEWHIEFTNIIMGYYSKSLFLSSTRLWQFRWPIYAKWVIHNTASVANEYLTSYFTLKLLLISQGQNRILFFAYIAFLLLIHLALLLWKRGGRSFFPP